MDRKTFYGGLGLKDRRVRMKEDMALVISGLDNDLRFLVGGEKAAKDKYAAKQRQSNASEDGMFALAWECECFQTLININKDLKSSISSLHLRISTNQRDGNIAGDLTSLRQRLLSYAKDLFSKHREAASHLMVFMIADEKRDMKPYAVPVRFIPYHSVTDNKLRELCMELRSAMVNLGMVVVGTVTDGEFNSIRTMGSKRAISIIQVMMDSKSEARSTNVNAIWRYFTPVAVPGANGTFSVRGQAQHPAIPVEDIVWLYDFMNADGNQVPFESAIHILKRKLFPANYDPYPWDAKMAEEDTKGCLKSLMATYLFRYKIKRMKEELNVDFSKHLYQPELCDVTGEYIHEREDHNHVLKRITECLRAGEIPGVDTRYFRDALHDAHSGLTYEALTGKQKQSVPHCEQVFSKGVLEFMQRNGHTSEAHFVETVRNWHKAADGRGLSEETRSKYNNDMINFLLTDWMPWHEYERDFSTIDVMRPIKGIKGFTREIVVALIANCESLELRRAEYQERVLPPEHPRASSTDDVEGFIAHLHDQLGDVFDHKEFLEQQPKILNEFTKKIDPELQFYYWTGHRHRFTTAPLPSFNDASGQTERLDRVRLSRRSDPGVFVANRASLPQRNSLTVRASFHRAPEQLPPPPTV